MDRRDSYHSRNTPLTEDIEGKDVVIPADSVRHDSIAMKDDTYDSQKERGESFSAPTLRHHRSTFGMSMSIRGLLPMFTSSTKLNTNEDRDSSSMRGSRDYSNETPMAATANEMENENMENVPVIPQVSVREFAEDLKQSLNLVNSTAAARNRKVEDQKTVTILEVKTNDQKQDLREITLDDLFAEITSHIAHIDEMSPPSTPMSSQGNPPHTTSGSLSASLSAPTLQKNHGVYNQSTPHPSNTNTNTPSLSPSPSPSPILTNASSSVVDIRFRDLRQLDFFWYPEQEPLIIVRRHCVVICLDFLENMSIRAVVMYDKIIFIVPPGADALLREVEDHLKDWSTEDDFPFEIHAYQCLLDSSIILMKKYIGSALEPGIDRFLNKTEAKKSGSMLTVAFQDKIRHLKNDLSYQITTVKSLYQALNNLLDDDKAMALMNLSKLYSKPSLYQLPLPLEAMKLKDEVEIVIAMKVIEFKSIERRLRKMQSLLESAEQLITLRLDTSRNEIMIATFILSIFGCSTAFGAYFTGVFGMNLDNASG